MAELPTGWDRTVNPTAYDRWRAAYTAALPIRDCGCPVDAPHESHCDHWLRYTT